MLYIDPNTNYMNERCWDATSKYLFRCCIKCKGKKKRAWPYSWDLRVSVLFTLLVCFSRIHGEAVCVYAVHFFSFYFCWRSNIFCRIPIIYRSWKLWHHETWSLCHHGFNWFATHGPSWHMDGAVQDPWSVSGDNKLTKALTGSRSK